MKKIRVLLADDHLIVRKGLLALLNEVDDIDVIAEASDGREAVQLIADTLPDVAVIDISMPLLNGLEAAQRISDSHPEIGVVILTMYDNEEYIIRTFQTGAKGYVMKSSAPSELVLAIRAASRGSIFLSPSISRQVISDFVHGSDLDGDLMALYKLTKREREVLQLIAEGYSTREIASQLFLSQKTVRAHRSKLMKKLDINSSASLTVFALQHGVINLDG